MFVCCDAKGLTHDIEIYTGKIEHCPGQPDIGASGNIVLRLLESVPRDILHQIYVDNWFNSLPLQVTLWKQGVGLHWHSETKQTQRVCAALRYTAS